MSDFMSILKDNAGGYSMMRAMFAAVTLTVLFNWTFVNIMKKELTPIDTNMITLIIGLAGAKAVQRFGEKGEITEISIDPTATTTTTTTTNTVSVTSQSACNANDKRETISPLKVIVENIK